MKEILLNKGFIALVDDEDYEHLNQYKWYVEESKHTKYAIRTVCNTNKYHSIRMHTMIMKSKWPFITDHIDHNGLNNQRSNLRKITQSKNRMNSKGSSISGYKGVSIVKDKFTAKIKVNGKTHNLGYFTDIIDAAKRYDKAAKKYFGEYAYLNFKE